MIYRSLLINYYIILYSFDGFDYFYYVKYLKGEEKEKISIFNGKKLELINNNLYFLEIKHSIKKLFSDYKKLHKISIESENKEKLSENSSSSLYKRDKLTSLGNSILTFSIFQKLIHTITKKEEDANLLYIVDSDFEENMKVYVEEIKPKEEDIKESAIIPNPSNNNSMTLSFALDIEQLQKQFQE